MLTTLLALSILLMPVGEGCSYDCNDSTWLVLIQNEPVHGLPDMTEEECRDIMSQLEPQTAPFTTIECVSVDIKREES